MGSFGPSKDYFALQIKEVPLSVAIAYGKCVTLA